MIPEDGARGTGAHLPSMTSRARTARRRSFLAALVGAFAVSAIALASGSEKGGGGGKGSGASNDSGTIQIPAGLSHGVFDDLLKKYVDDKGLVDYEGWKKNDKDMAALAAYVKKMEPKAPFAEGHEQGASLVNAYNALMITWVLEKYPVQSVRSTDNPFEERRWTIGGRKVSLDDIEKKTLVPLFGYRIHGALVCAARSCPPLKQGAYDGDYFIDQLEDGLRRWLSRDDLNSYGGKSGNIEVSHEFKWYKPDFEKVGGVRAVLLRHAPAEHRKILGDEKVDIVWKEYDWGLNDQKGLGKKYSKADAVWDAIVN